MGDWTFSHPVLNDSYLAGNVSASNLYQADSVADWLLEAALRPDFFPQTVVDSIDINDPEQFVNAVTDNWQEILRQNTAFISIAVSGLVVAVLLLFILFIGWCWMCCCKGEAYSKQSDTCKLLVAVPICTVWIGLASLGIFWWSVSTVSIVNQVGNLTDTTGIWISDIDLYVNNTVTQIDHLTRENCEEFIDDIHTEIDKTVDNFTALCSEIKQGVKLEKATDIVNFALKVTQQFNSVAQPKLLQDIDLLQQDLAGIVNVLDEVEAACTAPQCSQVKQDVDDAKKTLNSLQLGQIKDDLDNIKITDGEINMLKTVAGYMDQADAMLSNFSQEFKDSDVDDFLDKIDSIKDEIQSQIGNITTTVNDFDLSSIVPDLDVPIPAYALYVGLIPGFLVGFSILLFCTGILVGACGATGGQAKTCGSCFISFFNVFFVFFIVIFLLASTGLFLVGSVSEYAVCWTLDGKSQLNQKLVTTVDEKLHEALDGQADFSDTFFNVTDILDQCESNDAIYNVLYLSKFYDVDNLTDWKTTYKVQEVFDNIVGNVTKSIKDVVNEFSISDDEKNKANEVAKTFDTLNSKVLLVLNNIDVEKLNPEAQLVEVIKVLDQFDKQSADKIRKINDTFYSSVVPHFDDLKTFIIGYQQSITYDNQTMEETVNQILSLVDEGRDYMANQAVDNAVKTANSSLINLTNLGDNFIQFLIDNVKNKVGSCEPLYDVFEAAKATVCDTALGAFNGLWVGLGTMTVFWILLALFGMTVQAVFTRKIPEPKYVSKRTANQQQQNGDRRTSSYRRGSKTLH